MYIPSYNEFREPEQVLNFMQRFSFAIIVTTMNGLPVATHLPFLVEQRGEEMVLLSHFAKANPQGRDLQGQQVLVIFSEPHAYVSPRHYDAKASVPTWNYIAVHAYGPAQILHSIESKMTLLKKTINNYEPEYLEQWENLPEKFRLNMLNGIVAFEVPITDLQAKKKLSQNKNLQERERIINELVKNVDTNVQTLGEYMSEL